MGFSFAVITDAHFHPPGVPAQAAYDSDASFNDRNRAVVALVNQVAPDFVVHLGDIPHPVPGLPEHALALRVARETYDQLNAPLHVVPGNHDVGDKPHPLSPAPRTGPELHQVFERTWGPPWWSFDHDGCRFIGVDTPVMNTGLDLENEQWDWLERTLDEAAGRRVFVFAHYPPYLNEPHEAEHYDNLAQPGRARLLDLLARHNAKALFTGHVHHFFFHEYAGVELLTVPSTTFVRPGYAELSRVAPASEYGRNDQGRLGFLLVHIDSTGHRYEPVRSAGALTASSPPPRTGEAPICPLGVTFRYPWAATVDIPIGNLDPFVRKRVHNDLLTWACWDLGLSRVRLPLADLLDDHSFPRIDWLARQGARVVCFAAGMPDPATWDRIVERGSCLQALELVLPRPVSTDALDGVPQGAPELWLSVVGGRTQHGRAYFSHFPKPGFDSEDQDLALLPQRAVGLTHLIHEGESLLDAEVRIASQSHGRRVICHVRLPRQDEGDAYVDDHRLACRVADAWLLAVRRPEWVVLLDGFVDHDRGYYPRIGLVDRRLDPRPAYELLHRLVHHFGPTPEVTPGSDLFRWNLARDGVTGLLCTDPATEPDTLLTVSGASIE